MNKNKKNMYLIKRYCSKEFEAINVLEEAGLLSSRKVLVDMLVLARYRSRNYVLTDDVYKRNYCNALTIKRNYPQFRGIINYIYTKHGKIPTRFTRLLRTIDGERYIRIITFLNLFT